MYNTILKKAKEMYSLPMNTINTIKQSYYNEYSHAYRDNAIKLINSKLKNDNFVLTFQIRFSRATIKYTLQQILNDHELLKICHPLDLIQIGCLSKARELIQLNLKISNTINPRKFGNIKHYFKQKKQVQRPVKATAERNKEFSLSIFDIFINNQKIFLNVKIEQSINTFTLLLQDFILDKDLLFNTQLTELLKVGYLITEKTEKYELTKILEAY